MFPQMFPCLPTRGNIVVETKFANKQKCSGGNSLFPVGGGGAKPPKFLTKLSNFQQPPPPPFALKKAVFSPLLSQNFRKFAIFHHTRISTTPRFPPLQKCFVANEVDCELSLLSAGLDFRACERKGGTADNTSRNEIRVAHTTQNSHWSKSIRLSIKSDNVVIML